MSESKIEQELLAVAATQPKKKEDRQKYLTRLMLAVTKIPDADWEGLSTESQDWVNGGAEAHKANAGLKPDEEGYVALEDFPDYKEIDDNPPVDEEVDEEEAAPAPAVKAKDKKAEPKKVEVAKPPVGNGTGRKVSACHTIKTMVVKKPTISVAELSEKLKASGLKVSDVTIATLRSDLRDTLRVMNELNLGTFVL